MSDKIKVKYSEVCPLCGRRLLDKTNQAPVEITLKCPHCHKIVSVNLSLRRGNISYSRAAAEDTRSMA